jgi:peroxiredoxin Q/BCP
LQFSGLHDEFRRSNAHIIGVSRDSVESHARFKRDRVLPFSLLSDPGDKMTAAFGVLVPKNAGDGKAATRVARATFLIDPQGVIAKAWPAVSIQGHASDVLAALKESQAR